MDSKRWYTSKTMWAGITAIIIAIYNTVAPALGAEPFNIQLPAIPEFVYGILGALGLYGRATVTKVIK